MGDLADTLRQVGSSPQATVLGNSITAGSQIEGGLAQRRAADFEAAQDNVNAGQQQAAAQRAAYDQDRRTNLTISRARAVAGASGAGVSDGTVNDVVQRIAGEGAYRSQLALYQGDEAARALNTRADAARFMGQQAAVAGGLRAVSTVLSGGRTLLDKIPGKRSGTSIASTDLGGTGSYFDPSGWGMS
jgi:hypothetical protein